MRYRVIVVLLLALVTLAGCGGQQIDPQKLVQESAAAFEQVQTFHFKIDVAKGPPAPIQSPLGELILLGAEGDIQRPRRLSAELRAQPSGAPIAISMKAIVLEDVAYLSNPLNPSQWQQLEDATELAAFSPADGIRDVLLGLQNPQLKGAETLDGVETHHITGSADSAALQSLIGMQPAPGSLQVEVWIGAEDKLPRKISTTGAIAQGEPADIQRSMSLSQFNQSISIEAPQ